MTITQADVSAELRAELARQRIGAQSVADQAGCSSVSLRRYLAAERDMPVPVLMGVLDALGIQPSEFFKRITEREGQR